MSSRYSIQRLVLVGLAAAIIYPDRVLPWIGDQTGRVFARWHIFLFEGLAVAAMIVATLLLMQITPRLDWWDPVIYVGAVGLVRLLYWVGEAVFRGLFDL